MRQCNGVINKVENKLICRSLWCLATFQLLHLWAHKKCIQWTEAHTAIVNCNVCTLVACIWLWCFWLWITSLGSSWRSYNELDSTLFFYPHVLSSLWLFHARTRLPICSSNLCVFFSNSMSQWRWNYKIIRTYFFSALHW